MGVGGIVGGVAGTLTQRGAQMGVWKMVVRSRRRNQKLCKRLRLYARLIFCCLQSEGELKDKRELLMALVRKPSELPPYLKMVDWISKNAIEHAQKLRHEHVVPCAVLVEHFVKNERYQVTEKYIFARLLQYGMRALVTVEEDKGLGKKFKKSMPDSWGWNQSSFIRYSEAGISDLVCLRSAVLQNLNALNAVPSREEAQEF